MKAYKRSTRVAQLIQEQVAKIFHDIKELNKGLVTVTQVKLTDDLQTCRIFYSVIGSEDDKKNAKTVLDEKLKLNLGQALNIMQIFDSNGLIILNKVV